MHRFITRHRKTLQLCAYVLIAAAAIFASARTFQIADNNRVALNQIKQEGVDRRDQICEGAEREHLRDVTALKNTYLYLLNLSKTELGSTFNRFIIAQIPQTEEKAQIDVAPDFCDEPNVGLPEPDPKVPKRPQKINDLIRDLANQHPVIKHNKNPLITQQRPH